MKEVRQTLFGFDAETHGNCIQASVASVLEQDLDAVPHFGAYLLPETGDELFKDHGPLWFRRLRRWSRPQGFDFRVGRPDDTPATDFVILDVHYPELGWGHCLVGDRNLQPAWDPDQRPRPQPVEVVRAFLEKTEPYEPPPPDESDDALHRQYARFMDPQIARAQATLLSPLPIPDADNSPFARALRLLGT
jgi:hypothetical protein